jgi:hypothetical protein
MLDNSKLLVTLRSCRTPQEQSQAVGIKRIPLGGNRPLPDRSSVEGKIQKTLLHSGPSSFAIRGIISPTPYQAPMAPYIVLLLAALPQAKSVSPEPLPILSISQVASPADWPAPAKGLYLGDIRAVTPCFYF